MTARDFAATMAAKAAYLSEAQMTLACRFVSALVDHGGASQVARQLFNRRELEREWEEQQLHGQDLERRKREPA